MRIIFMGTPEFAVASMDAILRSGTQIAAVVTTPDKPAGRGRKIRETDVKQFAEACHLPVLQPEKLNDADFIARLKSFHADLFVVVAFRMLPEIVWQIPPLGTINLHASLLPQYRGAAPINWAVINGETRTGTTVFFIDQKMDTGNILSYKEEDIFPDDNAGSLHDRLMDSGARHLIKAIDVIEKGNFTVMPQKTPAILKAAPKIFRETCQINWNENAVKVHDFVRGLSPYPAARTTFVSPNGEKTTVKILETEPLTESKAAVANATVRTDGKKYLHVAASDRWVAVKSIQPEGKKKMHVEDFLNGLQKQTIACCE
ncbi:MAG: methionyl-tRNA formyltransferase [Bacteroidales bacterium]|jgi:methionyl-tRNA formyltransferase|nr:methionyl-tRNA formyltransferase [Bacteroidales bacterium]